MIAIHLSNEILMDEPIYLSFVVLQLSQLPMYETYYDTLQPLFCQETSQCQYFDSRSFVLSIISKDSAEDLYNLKDFFDSKNLNGDHEIFSNKNKKVVVILKIETPKSTWNDEFFLKK